MSEALTGYLLVAVWAVLAPTVFGLGCVRALGLGRGHGWRVSLSYGYLVGQLLLAPVVWLWLFAGRPVPGWSIALAAAVVGLVLCRRTARAGSTTGDVRSWVSCIALLVVAVPVLDAMTRLNVTPLLYADESLIWAAKAKVWFAVPADERAMVVHDYVMHADYPLWNPMMQCLAFGSLGRVLHWENRLPLQFASIALLMLLSAGLARRSHVLAAGVALLVFAGSTFAAWAGVAGSDVLLAFATLACAEALLRWRETGEVVWWRLACCSLAGVLASKNEGMLLTIALCVGFAVHWWLAGVRPPALRMLFARAAWLLLPAAAVCAQQVQNSTLGLANDLMNDAEGRGLAARVVDQLADYGPTVLSFFWGYCVDVARSSWLLPASLLAILALLLPAPKRLRTDPAVALLAATWMTVVGYLLVFVGTSAASLEWHLSTAADRIMLHVLPLATLGLAMAIWPRRCDNLSDRLLAAC